MRKEWRGWLLSGSLLLALGVTASVSFTLARRGLEGARQELAELTRQMAAASAQLVDENGNPRAKIPPSSAVEYVEAARQGEAALAALDHRLKNSPLLNFWRLARRPEIISAVEHERRRVASLRQDTETALSSLAEVAQRYEAARVQGERAAELGRHVLVPSSDESHFIAGQDGCLRAVEAVGEAARVVARAREHGEEGERARQLAAALTQWMAEDLRAWQLTAQSCADLLSEARDALRTHKNELTAALITTVGGVEGLNEMVNQLQPALTAAAEATAPLRRCLQQLEDPLLGGEVLGGLRALFGGGRPSGLSALDLLGQVDPSTAAAVRFLGGACDAVESARAEAVQLRSKVEPLRLTAEEFFRRQSRGSMLGVVRSAANARGYFAGQATWFDGPLRELQSAEDAAARLAAAAYRLRVPLAVRAVEELVAVARGVVNRAGEPLRHAREFCINAEAAIGRIEMMENQYCRSLTAIAQRIGPGQPGGHEGSRLHGSPRVLHEGPANDHAAEAFARERVAQLLAQPACERWETEPSYEIGAFSQPAEQPLVFVRFACAVGVSSVVFGNELWVREGGAWNDLFADTPLAAWYVSFQGDGLWLSETPHWERYDSHCCPSWIIRRSYLVAPCDEGVLGSSRHGSQLEGSPLCPRLVEESRVAQAGV